MIKSKQITMVRITNSIVVVAVVSVLFFHGHYHHDGGGMVAAAASGGGAGEADATSRGTMLTTVLDRVPVLTRKLSKNSKALKPDAIENERTSLFRSLVFAKVIGMYRSRQQSGRELQAEPVPDGLFQDYSWDDCLDLYFAFFGLKDRNEDSLCGYSRDDCLALYDGVQTKEDSDLFCQEVSPLISAYILDKIYSSCKDCDYNDEYGPENIYRVCMVIMQCPSTKLGSPAMCCGRLHPT